MKSGGTFGLANAIRGGTNANPYSRFYMGFWPLQQGTGSDWEPTGVITDYSGKGAHGTTGSLSDAEAGDNAGYLSSLAEAAHSGQIPRSDWTHRFATGSLLIFGQMLAENSSGNKHFLGNGASANASGFSLCINSSGRLFVRTWSAAGAPNGSASSATGSWFASNRRSFMAAYDYTDKSWTIGTDAVIGQSRDTTIASAAYDTIDSGISVATTVSLGGRPTTATETVANQMRYVHAFNFIGRGIPSNLSALFGRYHYSPMLGFQDSDFQF